MNTKENELTAIVNQQEEQLTRYKKRLQDLVIAYKKLTAEKERLQESLKTLTSPGNNSEIQSEEILKEEVLKLTRSLSSISIEKNQLETQFQTERKHLQEKNVELEEKVKHLTISLMTVKKSHDNDFQSKKSLMSLENNNREFELSNSIRELQKIVIDERKKKESKEMLIENLKQQLRETQEKLQKCNDQNAKKLENDLESYKMMENVQKELKMMKEQHDKAVQQEQMRTLNAEEATRRLAIEHEHRVSKLEEKLSQFSDLASKYNKNRQEDQDMIVKLKNRLMQLELENSSVRCEDDRVVSNEETLLQQLQHIKQQLIVHYDSSNQLHRVKEILLEGIESNCSKDEKHYKELYARLKRDMDTNQENQRTSSSRSNEASGIPKQKLQKLKNKISDLELRNSCLENELEVERENIKKIRLEDSRKWELKLNMVEKDYRNKLIALESELEKQRGRMCGILEEREKQMKQVQQKFLLSESTPTDVETGSKDTLKRQSSNLFYYLEDAARKDQEISRLRRNNSELKMKMHDLEQNHFHCMQLHEQLSNQIQRMEKQKAGTEELNTCYIKNVFLNYLLTNESSKRSHMLNAIFAILKFSDIEVNRVSKHQKQVPSQMRS